MVNTYDRGQHIQAILSKDCTKVKVQTLFRKTSLENWKKTKLKHLFHLAQVGSKCKVECC